MQNAGKPKCSTTHIHTSKYMLPIGFTRQDNLTTKQIWICINEHFFLELFNKSDVLDSCRSKLLPIAIIPICLLYLLILFLHLIHSTINILHLIIILLQLFHLFSLGWFGAALSPYFWSPFPRIWFSRYNFFVNLDCLSPLECWIYGCANVHPFISAFNHFFIHSSIFFCKILICSYIVCFICLFVHSFENDPCLIERSIDLLFDWLND